MITIALAKMPSVGGGMISFMLSGSMTIKELKKSRQMTFFQAAWFLMKKRPKEINYCIS